MRYIYNTGLRDLHTYCNSNNIDRKDLFEYRKKVCSVLVKPDTQEVFISIIHKEWYEGVLPCALYDIISAPKHFFTFFEAYKVNENNTFYRFKNDDFKKIVGDYAKEVADFIIGVLSNHLDE